MLTLSFVHSEKTINAALNKIGHAYEKREGVFYLMEKYADSTSGWRDCGIYYKKKDLADAVNNLINKQKGDLA